MEQVESTKGNRTATTQTCYEKQVPQGYSRPDVEEVISLDDLDQESLYAGGTKFGSGLTFDII